MAADSSLTSLHAALRKDCDELLGRLGAVMNGVERMGTGAMTEDEIHELLFTHLDEDRDGTISISLGNYRHCGWDRPHCRCGEC